MNPFRRSRRPGHRSAPSSASLRLPSRPSVGLSVGLLALAVEGLCGEPRPLDIARLQSQLTNGAPAAVAAADLLMAEAELRPGSPHLQYNSGASSQRRAA